MKQIVAILFLLVSCSNTTKRLTTYDIEIFRGTPVWKLAQAVAHQDTTVIHTLAATANVNYQETRFKETVLHYAVMHQLLQATESLLKNGADPNVKMYTGETPLIFAAKNYDTSAFLKLMLKWNGNVNVIANDTMTHDLTPLIAAAGTRLESVKILVSNGAEINFISPNHRNALLMAAMTNQIESVEYLLIEHHARYDLYPEMKNDLLAFFRIMSFDLASPEYAAKMRVVKYLKEHGVDYRNSPIPNDLYKIYPKEYLEKY